MNVRLLAVTLATVAGAVNTVWSAENAARAVRSRMPILVTPFYDGERLQISVGPISQKLAAADANSILQLVKELKKDQDRLRAEVMYVVAIRLYDLGHKDEAVYWFHSATYRGRLFSSILDEKQVGGIGNAAFELKHAYNAFHQLAGTYINGYAFGDVKKLENVLKKVTAEGKSLPKFAEIYPEVGFSDSKTWPTKNEEVAAGLAELLDFIRTKADVIKEQRKVNGIEGKY
jgi:KaiC/GvpD/RAD55 family RecA-like ATPase